MFIYASTVPIADIGIVDMLMYKFSLTVPSSIIRVTIMTPDDSFPL